MEPSLAGYFFLTMAWITGLVGLVSLMLGVLNAAEKGYEGTGLTRAMTVGWYLFALSPVFALISYKL